MFCLKKVEIYRNITIRSLISGKSIQDVISQYLFTKQNIEVSGWLCQTKTHNTHIVYQPFSRVTPPNYIALNQITWIKQSAQNYVHCKISHQMTNLSCFINDFVHIRTQNIEYWDAGSSDEKDADIQDQFHKRFSRPVIELNQEFHEFMVQLQNKI